MSGSHTPGPWSLSDYGWSRISDGGNPVFMGRISGRGGQLVHSGSAFGVFGETEDGAEANARLIAAAPDLLELAKLVYGSFGGGRVITFSDADIEAFEAAIAKAEGRK